MLLEMSSPFHFMEINSYFLVIFFMPFFFNYSFKNFLNTNIFKTTMVAFIFLNLLSNFPFSSCQMAYYWSNLMVGLTICSLSISAYFTLSMSKYCAHLLPYGSPQTLWLFLILLESISMVIRPFTLSLRITCNLIAGHIMLSLLILFKANWGVVLIVMVSEMLLSMIQSFVFLMLSNIYLSKG